MSDKTIIKKIAFAIFKESKILMVRGYKDIDIFKFLGGKPEGNESDLDCLKREDNEEINIDVKEDSISFLNEFENFAYNKPDTKVRIYLYTGEIIGDPIPSSEIVEIKYCDTNSNIDPRNENPIAKDIFGWLKTQGYIL